MKCLYVGLIFVLIGCSIKYTSFTNIKYPELGSIGNYTDNLFVSSNDSRSVLDVGESIRLKVNSIIISERNLFKNKDSIVPIDSTLISFEILDKLELMSQLNEDRQMLDYLKISVGQQLVSEVTMNFDKELQNEILSADEAYLYQHKQKTLSIELRKDNEAFKTVEFTDGQIVDYQTSTFCWGTTSAYRVQIMDLIPKGKSCSRGTYSTARKAEKKNDFGF